MDKNFDLNERDLRKIDLTRKYDDDFSAADGITWTDHILLYSITLLLALFIIWASFARLDEVSRGEGRVIPTSEVQIIQNLEGGIIDAFTVKEGETVEEGQSVLHLRNVQAKSDFEATNKKYYGLMATIARLQAEADGKAPEFSEETVRNAPESVSAERAAFEANKKQLDNQIGAYQEQLTQKSQEVIELEKRITDVSNVLKLAQKEYDMMEPMVARGSVSQKELLNIEREIAQQKTELNGLKLSLPRAEAAAKGAKEQLEGQENTFKAEAQKILSEKTVELNAIKETLTALKDKSERTEIKSPVRGIVKVIKMKTVGGVIRPGEPIMEIVPLEDKLLVEARIKPSDIAFISPGQKAVIRLSAYDFSIYGALEGQVIDISADSFTTEKGDSFYRVKVRTGTTKLKKGDKELDIIPGMQATVDIVTGEKTIMNYLLKPFIKASKTAMTER